MRRIVSVCLCLCCTTAAVRAQIGPDVIVGDIEEVVRWTDRGELVGLAIGTWSCNAGDEPIRWEAENNHHPVIAQNLYRLKDGRFEQIGLSWLKHGFFALSYNLCFDDCQETDGRSLGVHCADPYSGDTNGDVFYLGPRSLVNATTGEFPYPYEDPDGRKRDRRLMVQRSDLDPDFNAGALYFAEGQYVTPDDAAAGNGLNNASYRAAVVSRRGRHIKVNIDKTQGTVETLPAVYAWRQIDPGVIVRPVDVPGDGRYFVASRVTDLGNGTSHYEYAVFNLNSHRSGASFEIPVPEGVSVTNVGFHDIEYRGGEGEAGGTYSGEDWRATRSASAIRWETESFDVNVNANALRFSTMYNFRFDADRAPTSGNAHLGLFRPGTPDFVSASCYVPLP